MRLRKRSYDSVLLCRRRWPRIGEKPANILSLIFGVVGDRSRWLWLLHDDAAPAPDALSRLLAHIVVDQSIDITGPKLVLPKSRHSGSATGRDRREHLGTGRRDLQLEPGEIDQGQRDQPSERLGVSTCGMLVRRGVWEDLGGLDPGLPIFRDGVDFVGALICAATES